MFARLYVYLMMAFSLSPGALCTASEVNPLNGQHLRILAMEYPASLDVTRNATGHIIRVDGIQADMIEELSQILNFSYSFLPNIVSFVDDSPSAKGGISYLVNDEADYYLSSALVTLTRFQKADFPAAIYFGSFSTMMPYPRETYNLAASFDTLSYMVWILIAIAASVTVVYLKTVQENNLFQHREIIESNAHRSNESVVLYVIGNLVSQGQNYFPKRFSIRIAAGAWCCTCFFLVQIYCCTLTSHLTSPNQKPLVNSFFDVADTPGVSLTVEKGFAIDTLLKITESAHVKRFANILKSDNRLMLCNVTSDCLDNVKRTGNAVYSAPLPSLIAIMATDLKKTGTCHYTRTKETFWSTSGYTMLRKNSPYTESISKGILRLHESGLLAKWQENYFPSTSKCIDINQRNGMPRLSTKHLSSAFVILVAGFLISFVAFGLEILIEEIKRFRRAMRVVVV